MTEESFNKAPGSELSKTREKTGTGKFGFILKFCFFSLLPGSTIVTMGNVKFSPGSTVSFPERALNQTASVSQGKNI